MDRALPIVDAPAPARPGLLRPLLVLALPVMAEQVLNMLVGLTDVYLANHLRDPEIVAPAAAAVGTVGYVLWFVGLLTGAVGTGSTAIIARAIGARHRSLANSVCGQSVAAATLLGIVLGALLYAGADWVAQATALAPSAQGFALAYLRLLSFAMPFMMLQFIGGACLRGAGDTATPAKVMIVVGLTNIIFSYGLTYGAWGMPEMGFDGIAVGTVIAYVIGGLIQLAVLLGGRGGVRLYLHRLRPHWNTLRRILRIGIPSGLEGLLTWMAQFGVVIVINAVDSTSRMGAAHINAIRIESLSFLSGFAFATAAATLVGQSLGRRDAATATRAGYLSFAVGGGIMTGVGLLFVLFAQYPAGWIADDPVIAALTASVLRIAGVAQAGFGAAMIFSGALRGAGDTFWVMVLNLISVLGVRFVGVLIVGLWLRMGLIGIWMVLCAELFVRGALLWARFAHGGWRQARV